METMTLSAALRVGAPHSVALLVSQAQRVNVMTLSWWTVLSRNPPMLGVSLSRGSLTREILSGCPEFTLCLPQVELARAVWRCGSTSGRSVDKVREYGLELEPSAKIAVPGISGSGIVYECRVSAQHEAGDHTFFIAEVIHIRGKADVGLLFALDGYARPGTVLARPVEDNVK